MGPLDYQGSRSHHFNSKSCDMLNLLSDEFSLLDVWTLYHPKLGQSTRYQQNPHVLSRLNYIFIPEKPLANCECSKIYPGVSSDHLIVSLSFKTNPISRG